jgi:hypothetical protein
MVEHDLGRSVVCLKTDFFNEGVGDRFMVLLLLLLLLLLVVEVGEKSAEW